VAVAADTGGRRSTPPPQTPRRGAELRGQPKTATALKKLALPLDRHCARQHEARAGRAEEWCRSNQRMGRELVSTWWTSVKSLTPTPPSEPLKPSTGAAVRDHRNAVRDRSESLSAIDRNHCPHSPESASRRFAPGVPFGEVLEVSDNMMTSIPPEQIGRMLSGDEASQLILRLVDGRGRPRK
jgi:hypothetical protein